MIVFTCKPGESLVIDEHMSVTVKSLEKGRLVLAIESPRHDPPYREETFVINPSDVMPSPVLAR